MVVVTSEVLETLIPWLKSHEDDIAMGVNDFGDLSPVFEALFMEKPQEMRFPINKADWSCVYGSAKDTRNTGKEQR